MKENSTFQEMLFLDGVAGIGWIKPCPVERRIKALKGYANTALDRRWDGGVKAEAVRKYALVLLERLNGTR